jgi:hypothetical protein
MAETQAANEMCACGRPLHYQRSDTEAYMRKQVAMFGAYVKVRTPDGAFAVPRHYMALHHIIAAELPALARQHNWRKVD